MGWGGGKRRRRAERAGRAAAWLVWGSGERGDGPRCPSRLPPAVGARAGADAHRAPQELTALCEICTFALV